jgi:hypothetical protein
MIKVEYLCRKCCRLESRSICAKQPPQPPHRVETCILPRLSASTKSTGNALFLKSEEPKYRSNTVGIYPSTRTLQALYHSPKNSLISCTISSGHSMHAKCPPNSLSLKNFKFVVVVSAPAFGTGNASSTQSATSRKHNASSSDLHMETCSRPTAL